MKTSPRAYVLHATSAILFRGFGGALETDTAWVATDEDTK